MDPTDGKQACPSREELTAHGQTLMAGGRSLPALLLEWLLDCLSPEPAVSTFENCCEPCPCSQPSPALEGTPKATVESPAETPFQGHARWPHLAAHPKSPE